MNLWREINPITKRGINCVVEIPKGSTKKYELDVNSGKFKTDRRLFPALNYNYGFIPGTYAEDDDPLDVIVLGKKLKTGSVVECRPIGILKMQDEKVWDDKVLAVPVDNVEFKKMKNIGDVSKTILNDIKAFFRHYKDKYHKKTKVFKWLACSKAELEIRKSIGRYNKIKNVL